MNDSKRYGVGLIAMLLLVGGCTKKSSPVTPDAGVVSPAATGVRGATRARPIGAGAPMNLAKPDFARIRIDLSGVRAAIREYRMVNGGQPPPSIDALDLSLSFPADIAYDSQTGSAKSRTYPQL